MNKIFLIILVSFLLVNCNQKSQPKENIRFATFNTALYRDEHGVLWKDLKEGKDEQIKIIAEIIQRNRPDVLALQEFDYYRDGEYLEMFQENYLSQSFNGSEPIEYPYMMAFPSNTGLPTEFDFNNDGSKHSPEDAYGYGKYPGQYAFAILSKYPFDTTDMHTFQKFLWKDMPGALWPADSTGKQWYSEEEKQAFRLSSKNHVDIPVKVNGRRIHVLIAHPTPPSFDGEEDRNGKRNHDEIRLFADYISPDAGDYLYDDKGEKATLNEDDAFVIMGDMNADPLAGSSYENAIDQLLQHPQVNTKASVGEFVPSSKGSLANHEERPDEGHPAQNTAVFGLRIDYVLPSDELKVTQSGVFWPAASDSLSYLTIGREGSDHRLVWVDVEF